MMDDGLQRLLLLSVALTLGLLQAPGLLRAHPLHDPDEARATAADADFDNTGTVDFSDFIGLVQAFGSDQARYDLDGDGAVGFADFLAFVGLFGQNVATVSVEAVPAGTITTWAGTGKPGWDGDDRPLLRSRFYWPVDVTITASDEVYILDWNNHRVRHVTAEGTLETVIGTDFVGDGPYDESDQVPPGADGTAVHLNHPTHLLPLPDGTLLLTAWHNHKLRSYDPRTGFVQVICGAGAGFVGDGGQAREALLNQPTQTVLGPEGSLYVLDQRNQRVRRIAPDGTISTVVGTGGAGFVGDGGPPLEAQIRMPAGSNPPPGGALAFDPQGRLYISDTLNHRIRRVDFTLDVIETVAGTGEAGFSGDGGPATGASLNNPRDIVVGPDGRLYVADELNHCIRAVDLSTGTIATVAGNGAADFAGDGGPATQASLNRPGGIVFDAHGHLYIADTYNHRIRHVTLVEEIRGGVILAEEPEEEPREVYASIATFAGTGEPGKGTEGAGLLETELYLPQDLTLGPDGRFYILDWNNHRIRVVDNGVVRTLIGSGELGDAPAGPALEVSLNHPTHVSFDPQGRLIVSAWHNSMVLRYDFDTGHIEPIVGDGSRAFGGDGGPASEAWVDLPSATAFDPAGRMYISDQENQRIRMVDLNGIITTVVGTGEPGFSGDGGPASGAQIYAPVGQSAPPTSRIAIDTHGDLYLADTFNNRIRKVDTNGIVTTVAGSGERGFSGDGGPAIEAALFWPCDVAVDAEGNLFIADTFNHCIRKVDTNGIIATLAGLGGTYGNEGDGDHPRQAKFKRPYGIELDKEGNLYIADTHNHRIRVVYKDKPPASSGAERFFTAEFMKSYVQVRDCRLSIAHDGYFIVVYASPEAANAYKNGIYPFAPGTVIVKALYEDVECTKLAGYASMRKGEAGTAPASGDWEWQTVGGNGGVQASGQLQRCIGCHTACTEGRDFTCTDP